MPTFNRKISRWLFQPVRFSRKRSQRQVEQRRLLFEGLEQRQLLATFGVVTTADSGAGSLRQAILDANASTGPDLISFNIPVSGVHTIQPLSALPTITDPVVIDGYTQAGSSPNTLASGNDAVLQVELDGSLAGLSHGLHITAGNSTVRGLTINNFEQDGIRLETGGSNFIAGNFIGIDPTGQIARANGTRGITQSATNQYAPAFGVEIIGGSSFNVIGTNGDGADDAAERNVISANIKADILIIGTGTNNNVVAGNFIGTNADGTSAFGQVARGPFNHNVGVWISSAATFNRIGTNADGTADDAERNLISGHWGNTGRADDHHSSAGVQLTSTTGNVVAGNYIGTDVTGTVGLLNGTLGYAQGAAVSLGSSTGALIGSNADGVNDAAERNIISGNQSGVAMSSGGNHIVAGNYIGTDVTGTVAVPNTTGVIAAHTDGTLIGGTTVAARNVISGNVFWGVSMSFVAGTGNRVQGNFIGVDAGGTAALGNLIGVSYSSNTPNVSNVLIGGTTPGAGNVISANRRVGVQLLGGYNAIVQGNYIGTDVTGTVALGNLGLGPTDGGVVVSGFNHLIGGASPGAGNVISGNEASGVLITLGSDNIVQGNYIGTDATGTVRLGNRNTGVRIQSGQRNLIGGSVPGEGNIISGNGRNSSGVVGGAPDGVHIVGGHAVDTVVQGNRIGLDKNGNPLGNERYGVFSGTTIGHTIGGVSPGEGNVIAHNLADGVFVNTGNDISIRGNSIHSNGGLGIDLNLDGVTANDLGDPDTGANLRQNYPVLSSALSFGGGTHITGSLNSAADTEFTLDFYSNAVADPSGFGEGETYLGSAMVTTDASGNATFNAIVAGTAAVGQFVSATATDPNGNTSEFSAVDTVEPFVLATISGTKFNDLDSNGSQDVGEPGLANWVITLDAGADGSVDDSTTTDSNGDYSFSGLEPGIYRIREVQQPNWTQTSVNPGDLPVDLSGQDYTNVNFGNHQDACLPPGDIIGDPEPFDLTAFSVIQYNLGLQGNANWQLSNNNTVATQVNNSDPSIFLSSEVLTDDVAEGSWMVNPSGGDDDLMGFVFGFQDTEHFYLFDWKRGSQSYFGFAQQGMSVKVVNASSPLTASDLWPSAGNGTRVQTLYHNTIQWQHGVEYDFRLETRPGEFTITVYQGNAVLDAITIQDSTYSSGKFGFYNFSQGPVSYSGFTRAAITPIPTTTIEGTKFHDLDGDGVRDIGEPGLASWTIQLDANADGSVDDTTTTDADGNYRFADLPVGTYRIREVQQPGWTQTSDDPEDVMLTTCMDIVSGVDFGNLDQSTITGIKFYDMDGSGTQQIGEPVLAHWPIFLDTNGDGSHTIGEPFTYTGLNGTYSFTDLDPGTYRVREVQQPGWMQTSEDPDDIEITADGQVFANVDFGNDRDHTTLITGTKFNDANGNGTQDVGEGGLAHWPIFVDANQNGVYDLGERLTFTNIGGQYAIAGLPVGSYSIREIQRPGWTQTTANPGVVVTAAGQTLYGGDFGNQRDATTLITGRKFFDADSDGVADPGEPGLRYWPIFLDTNSDGMHQSGEPVTWTDWNGFYHFAGVAPGTYRVREIQQSGWTQTTANPANVIVTAAGQTFENIDFGNKSSRSDPGYEPPTDLEVTKGALRAVAGEQITYTLTVKNKGPADSYGVILGDQLKPGLVFESVTSSQGTCLGGQTIICAVGPLAVGESASITIVAHVQSWVVDEIENEVCVYSTGTDTEPANNCAIARTPIDTRTDLELVKTADGLRAIAGTDLTYTLRVTNNGPSDSTNVTLEDELPPEVTFVSAVSTHGTCTLEVTTVNTVVCDLGTVANGDTAIVTLVVHVGPWVPDDAIITNIGRVRDPHGGSGESITRIPCGRSTDFELNKTGPFTTIDAEVYYVIEVTNHGPSNSAGPIVGDDLPDDINFLRAVPSQGVCNQADPLLCNLGPMVVGQTETVTVFVGVPETVVIENVRNEAFVQPPEGDPNLHNNWGGTGGPPRNFGLGIVKEAPPEIPAGEYLTYTLLVTNEGPDDASNVIVGDTIPAGLIFVSATPTQGFCHSIYNPIICFLGAMEAGDVAEVKIVVFVPPSIPEGFEFVNRGYGWGGIPPVFGEARTRVIRRADIGIEKIAPPDVIAGTEMTYTLRTRNRGPSDSTNITLEDVLPPEVNLISATPTQGTCTDTDDAGQTTVSCDLGDIPSGGVAEVEIVVFVPSYTIPGTVIANGVCLENYSYDPDFTNNCAYVETGVGEQSDTGLIKVSTPAPVTAGENIEYTLEAFNLGPSDARQFVLGDTLPAPLVFVSASTTQGTCDFVNGTVRCDIGYLAAGQHEFVTIIAFVPPTTPDGTVIENTACVIECGHDIFHDNDCSTVRNTIRAQSVLTGVKFHDVNGNGVQDDGELGIEGWQIFLDLDGDDVLDANERSTFTDANGFYTFTGLGKATWFVREVQDPGWLQTTLNPPGVTVTGLLLTYAGGDFGNKQGSLAGFVYIDADNDGQFDIDENGIEGVTVSLIGTDDRGDAVNRSVLTGATGAYTFAGLRPGSYRIVETQPGGYLDGKDTLGSLGTTAANDEFFIELAKGQDGVDYNFGELEPAKLSGYVYDDTNDDGQIDFGEAGAPGVQITLTGTNDLNEIINQIVTTDTQGYYEFDDLRPGTYVLDEQQPAGYLDGRDTVGTLGGTVANDQFSDLTLANASHGMNYNFGEHADVGLHRGQTATIGYWQNNNGQALIQSLNGGANSTALGYWLATNFANMYGANAGANNLAGKSNAQIADFYVTLFKQKGQKLDAQVLATAFAVYVTDSDLAGNNAVQYGFTVSSAGTGAATFSVGSSGAAFGVANDTRLTVLQMLTATNAQTVSGNLYNGLAGLRDQANRVYDGINRGGDIF